jgi:palmitoyl transferase
MLRLMVSARTRLGAAALVCALVIGVTTTPAAAQEAPTDENGSAAPTTTAGVVPDGGEPPGLWHKTASGIKAIWTSGGSDVYVPGYIWHLPYKYSDEQIDRYNTTAWGFGYGRTFRRGEANHPHSLYAIVSADSYAKPQYMLGYAWRARWHVGGGPLALGGGLSALVVGREDKFNYAPLPGVVPLGSIGVDRFELMGAYVPYFEVGYFFLRLNFGEGARASRQK